MQENILLISKIIIVILLSILIYKFNEAKKKSDSKKMQNLRYCIYCLVVIIGCIIKKYFQEFNRFVFTTLFIAFVIINELEIRLEKISLEGEFHNLVKSFGMIIFKLTIFMLIIVMVGIIVFIF